MNNEVQRLDLFQMSRQQVSSVVVEKMVLPKDIHLFDEAKGTQEHFLSCDACGLEVHIKKIVPQEPLPLWESSPSLSVGNEKCFDVDKLKDKLKEKLAEELAEAKRKYHEAQEKCDEAAWEYGNAVSRYFVAGGDWDETVGEYNKALRKE